jgi:HTH-type transcriptional regulator, sugar sensing transcriptional regulator
MRMENVIRDNQNIIQSELMPIYEKSGMKEKPEIWVVRGVYNIAAKVNEIIETSEQELLIALPQAAEDIAKLTQPLLRMSHEKGVRITVLASEETSQETVRMISRVASVRLKNNMFGGGVIGDSRQVVILLTEGRSDNGAVEPIAIWVTNDDETSPTEFPVM